MADKKCPKKEENDDPGIPEWVVTFGDMMSLLLTFFIMLYSMSTLQTQQTLEVIESLRKQFGHDKSPFPAPGKFAPSNSMIAQTASMGRAQLKDLMRGGDKVKAPVGDYPRVTVLRPSEDAATAGNVHFADGSAELDDDAKRKLQEIAEQVSGHPQILEIAGHTNARPLEDNSPYRNHWDLAYARCYRVMEYLIELGVKRNRIRLNVAAANEPTRLDGSAEAQRESDRVEVMEVADFAEDRKGTEEERRMMFSDPSGEP